MGGCFARQRSTATHDSDRRCLGFQTYRAFETHAVPVQDLLRFPIVNFHGWSKYNS